MCYYDGRIATHMKSEILQLLLVQTAAGLVTLVTPGTVTMIAARIMIYGRALLQANTARRCPVATCGEYCNGAESLERIFHFVRSKVRACQRQRELRGGCGITKYIL